MDLQTEDGLIAASHRSELHGVDYDVFEIDDADGGKEPRFAPVKDSLRLSGRHRSGHEAVIGDTDGLCRDRLAIVETEIDGGAEDNTGMRSRHDFTRLLLE